MTDITAPIISTIGAGFASVSDRESGRELGTVSRISWPHEQNGIIWTEDRWEARRPHELATASAYGFPTFPTRREAATHLATH